MAFPDDNKSFELGTLQGYEVEGRCLTTSSFYSRTFSQNIQPRSGQFFAVIDDPTLVDNDGNRIPGPDISIDTSGYQDKIDSSGIYLMGVDGARLSARDVALPKNSLVRFCWAFEVGDRRPVLFNDFAVFEVLEAGTDKVIHQHFLAQQISGSTRWHTYQFTSKVARSVHLRWVSSNGRLTADPRSAPKPSHRGFPSTLLLDAIDIIIV